MDQITPRASEMIYCIVLKLHAFGGQFSSTDVFIPKGIFTQASDLIAEQNTLIAMIHTYVCEWNELCAWFVLNLFRFYSFVLLYFTCSVRF